LVPASANAIEKLPFFNSLLLPASAALAVTLKVFFVLPYIVQNRLIVPRAHPSDARGEKVLIKNDVGGFLQQTGSRKIPHASSIE
jgi:hypothetical protein